MKVLAIKESHNIHDNTVFRSVDILLNGGEARRLPPQAFKEAIEGLSHNVKVEDECLLKKLFGINEPKLEQEPQKARPHIAPVKGFSIQTVHVNEEKKIVTVVFSDGTKQIVKCSPEDSFDTEIGFALAVARKLFNSKTQVRKFIADNAKVIKAPEPAKPKKTRKPRKPKVVEESPKEE